MSGNGGQRDLAVPLGEQTESLLVERKDDTKFKAVGLDQDVYGAGMFSIIFDYAEIFSDVDHDGMSRNMNFLRVTYVVIILICNYILQVSMLSFIWTYVTLPSVHNVQSLYRRYHEDMFVDGVIDNQKFAESPEQDEICAIAFSNFWFMYFILCLWWCTMLKDVRMIERLYRAVKSLGHATKASEMIGEHEEGEPTKVMKVTTPVRWLLYLVIIVPKFLISCLLLIIGTVWLSATDSYADLILNAVALEFVIAIDELIFEGLLPSSIHERIEETVLCIVDKAVTPQAQTDAIVSQYIRSVTYFVMTTIGVYIFMTYGQYIPRIGVLPGYANDIQCPGWIEQQIDWVCSAMPWRDDCFAFD